MIVYRPTVPEQLLRLEIIKQVFGPTDALDVLPDVDWVEPIEFVGGNCEEKKGAVLERRGCRFSTTLRFDELDRSILGYYAHKYNKDMSRVVRGIVREFARADKSFAPAEYERYVVELLAEQLDDQESAEVMRDRAGTFAAGVRKTREQEH